MLDLSSNLGTGLLVYNRVSRYLWNCFKFSCTFWNLKVYTVNLSEVTHKIFQALKAFILKGCRRQQNYLVLTWERVCFLCLYQGCQWPLSVLALGQKERIINGDCISNCSTYLISIFWPRCSKTCLILLVEYYELHILLNTMSTYSTCPVCVLLLLQAPFSSGPHFSPHVPLSL